MALGKERLVVLVDPAGRTTAIACDDQRQAEKVLHSQREPFTIITILAEQDGKPVTVGRYGVGSDRKIVAASGGKRGARVLAPTVRTNPNRGPDLESYDTIIVAFSGGKDSLACLLHLLELGVPRDVIELWHHDVDGREGSTLMDWPCTRDYCRVLAEAFGIPLYFSWKVGGFEGEMDRDKTPTAPTCFETPYGTECIGGKGPPGTRLLFPQVSADLSVRWCSAYLKIDVCAAAVRNQSRFDGQRTLVVSGERAQESPGRAKYKEFEPHRSDARTGRKRRHVDTWRPVHKWNEEEVWQIIERWKVNPHPAYRLGWGRLSCAACIFGSPDQWASLRLVNPRQFAQVAKREAATGKLIKRGKYSVTDLADRGQPYELKPKDVAAAVSHSFKEPAILERWQLPQGAFGDATGPT